MGFPKFPPLDITGLSPNLLPSTHIVREMITQLPLRIYPYSSKEGHAVVFKLWSHMESPRVSHMETKVF